MGRSGAIRPAIANTSAAVARNAWPIRDLLMPSTFDTVANIISETCDIPRDTIKPESHAINDLGIDSLDFLDIAFAIDKAFGIKMPLEQWTQEVNDGKATGRDRIATVLWQFGRDRASFVLFLGVFLTGFGSTYYHWDPNDDTLFWDRLPMALTFMAILAVAVEERVSAKAGAILLWPLLALAVFSLLLWRWTDDLRLYGWVQFFPCIALPLLFVACPAKYSGTSYWLIAAAFYALAKLFEFYDHAIYSVGFILSGHTLKHFAAASACFAALRYFQTRRPVS